jgi:RNA polymerase sigma factor (sigma-70 family)
MDDDRFEELDRRFRARLVGQLRRWCHDPEDVAQKALIQMWRKGEAEPGFEWPYLWTIAIRLARNERRDAEAAKRGGGATVSTEVVEKPIAQESLSAESLSIARIDLERLRRRVADVMHLFPAETRRAIVLRYRDGFTSKEIAKKLGLTDTDVRTRLWRAERLFREHLGEPPAGMRWLDAAGGNDDHKE